ncbi:MAG: PAS domain-containing protein [Xanthobacteraceae bacterium]|nr:MAG: PAS domain-containing protein [Xanthobacteraceae bacterium]
MSDSGTEIQLRGLRDARLAALAAAAKPAWLWSIDGARVIWANAAGAALLGATTSVAALSLEISPADPLRRQVAQLAGRLSPNGAARLERLRGFGGPFGRLATFACSRLVLADGSVGVLLAAAEPLGKPLPLAERLSRLIDGIATPLAAFLADGSLSEANAAARPLIGDAASLEALGLEAVRGDVLRDGRAEMIATPGRCELVRIGSGAEAAIVVLMTPSAAPLPRAPEQSPQTGIAPLPPATDTPAIMTSSSEPPRNVVPFPGAEPKAVPAPILSAMENHAFNELARKLSQRLNADTTAADDDSPAAAASREAEASPPQASATEKAVLDRLPVGVLVYRLDQLLYANRAFLEATGYDSLHALASAGGLDALFVDVEPGSTGNSAGAGTPLALSTTRGGQVPVDARLYSVPWEGETALALIFNPVPTSQPQPAADANENVALRAELAAVKRQAEHTAATKSDILAKISHELRAPLSAIIGFSEVMIDERFGPLGNERYLDYLKDIRASGERVVALINEFVDLSRAETGRLDLVPTDIHLNEMVEQCVALMQPQANRERIIIRTALAPAAMPVRADARSLRQIVLNLIGNSIRLAQPGGQVIVSTAAADLGETALRVRDTGPGLSAQQIAAALEPFRISDQAESDGAGISLSLTKALTEANGARFQIRSTAPGGGAHGGTLVEVLFPAVPRQSAAV